MCMCLCTVLNGFLMYQLLQQGIDDIRSVILNNLPKNLLKVNFHYFQNY